MYSNVDSAARDEYLGQVDVRDLSYYRWPLIRAVASGFVNRLELWRHQRQLLRSGQWDVVRAEPIRDEAGVASTHVFDLYGSTATD